MIMRYGQILLLLAMLVTDVAGMAQRQRFNFNADWAYTLGDDSASTALHPVTLPHAWNEDQAFRVSISQLSDTVVWYSKVFTLPASAAGQRVFIEFEGARQSAEVWLNGHRLGLHQNGVTAFGYDLTPYVRYDGPNTLRVRTDNDWHYTEQPSGTRFQWNNANFNANYGGLPKNVWLHVTGHVFQSLPLYSTLGTTGTYIYATDYDLPRRRATIHAESQVVNASSRPQRLRLQVEVIDAGGHPVARYRGADALIAAGDTTVLSASHRLSGIHFWSWGYGYLYTVRTSLVSADGTIADAVETRTGFRKTQFGEGRIWLNDRVLMVHGFAQRTSNEWPAVGMSVPAWMSDYSNALMVQCGANLVRWMHVTPWRQDVESCDRVGLLQAMPAGDAEKDCTGRQWQQRCELMRDAIIYFRNNPSIIFYEGGNESISRDHILELLAIRDRFDPHGGRAMGSREMLDITESEYGGEMLYINKSGRHPMWAMEYCRDEGYRQYWDDYSYPYHRHGAGPLYRRASAEVYNQNQDQLAIEHVRRWYDYYEQRPGQGRRCSSGGVKIIFSDTNTHNRSEFNYRVSGVVDAMRIPKDAYYVAQVMWDSWVDIDYDRTHIIGHWDYEPGTRKDVYVVSTSPRVSLCLGDSLVATSTEPQYRFLHTFRDVAFQPGQLIARGSNGSADTLTTAGRPHHLQLTLMHAPDGMKADGADLAIIQVEVVDSQGRRCPLDHRTISWSLAGPAEWRGGIAKSNNHDNHILATALPVEAGVGRVIVRSTTLPGDVRLTASAPGLPDAQLCWQTVALPGVVCAGLSTYVAGDAQPLYLERGPTPSTPSYTDRFMTIGIDAVSAGANEAEAALSYDDNELSEWRNDGRLQTAWITYRLQRPAAIDQISLKLTGWRQRSYPIEVLADDTVIWSGLTPKSLGYVELRIEHPVLASHYTIRQIGAAEDREAFGQITELVAPAAGELDLYKATDGDQVKGELRIVEVDFLESITPQH